MAGIFWISASSEESGTFCAAAREQTKRTISKRRMDNPRATHCTEDVRYRLLRRGSECTCQAKPGDKVSFSFEVRFANEPAHGEQSEGEVEERFLIHVACRRAPGQAGCVSYSHQIRGAPAVLHGS